MYKIYINRTPIFLCKRKEIDQLNDPKLGGLRYNFDKHPGQLLQYIEKVEKDKTVSSLTIYSDNLENLKESFFGHFKVVIAAGGVVFNKEKKVLMIYRRGAWDLPKGKVDKHETIEAAAVREVKEETGLKHVKRKKLICVTYHVYTVGKGVRAIKPTYWYKMKSKDIDLTPQIDEDIEIAIWDEPEKYVSEDIAVYSSIRDVINIIINKKKEKNTKKLLSKNR